MPVDFKDELLAGLSDAMHFLQAGAIQIAKDLGMFNKMALSQERRKLRAIDKKIMLSIDLIRALSPGCMRDANRSLIVIGKQCCDQAGFTCSRGSGNHVNRTLF